MSFQAMTWATQQRLPASQKLVLLMLSNCCNHHSGRCTPKIKTLADECGMSETTVKAALKALAETALVKIIPRFLEGVQLPNSYQLNLAMSTAVAPVEIRGGGSELDPGWVGNRPRVGRQTPTEPGIEPGIEPIPPYPLAGGDAIADISEGTPAALPAGRRAESRQKASTGTTLKTWLADCADRAVSPIPADAAVWAYADGCGLPESFVRLAWREFKGYWQGTEDCPGAAASKRKKDWPGTFLNAVKGNRSRLWRSPSVGQYVLTTEGMQAYATQQAAQREVAA